MSREKPSQEIHSSIKRFQKFLAKLLSVSKRELDEAIEAEKRLVEPTDVEPAED